MSPAIGTDAGSTGPHARRRFLRVLVVDDEPDTVMTLLTLLGDAGYDAKGAGSAKAAIQLLKTFDPDVIISDIAMPGMTGWDLAREVRIAMGDKRPMLIAISGQYTKGGDKVLAEMAGYNYYLTKPADPKVLLTLLEKADQGYHST